MTLKTMPNELPRVPLWVENTIALPKCCPVSGNPQAGSRVRIRYRPAEAVLEVYSLKGYIAEYVGGHENGIRSMEAMIQRIALDCAEVLGVPVVVLADLVLHPHQEMRVRVKALPPA
jgi:NADPH-dependent 7-cyano-7-deazaguanine reductase QueF